MIMDRTPSDPLVDANGQQVELGQRVVMDLSTPERFERYTGEVVGFRATDLGQYPGAYVRWDDFPSEPELHTGHQKFDGDYCHIEDFVIEARASRR